MESAGSAEQTVDTNTMGKQTFDQGRAPFCREMLLVKARLWTEVIHNEGCDKQQTAVYHRRRQESQVNAVAFPTLLFIRVVCRGKLKDEFLSRTQHKMF